jgi:hypothetical protein
MIYNEIESQEPKITSWVGHKNYYQDGNLRCAITCKSACAMYARAAFVSKQIPWFQMALR